MDREAQDTQAQGVAYEFEVKEQDRWLPIANGTFVSFLLRRPWCIHSGKDGASVWQLSCRFLSFARFFSIIIFFFWADISLL